MDHDITSQPTNNKQKFFYGYIIVLIAFIVLAINNGSRASFGVFLKPILTDLGSTRGLISGVFSVARLVNAFVTVPVGRLVDKSVGRRPPRVLGAAVLLSTAAMFGGANKCAYTPYGRQPRVFSDMVKVMAMTL